MPTTLIQNGRVIDPSQDVDRVTNVLLRDGKVVGDNPVANRLNAEAELRKLQEEQKAVQLQD